MEKIARYTLFSNLTLEIWPFGACLALNYAAFGTKPLILVGNHDISYDLLMSCYSSEQSE